MSDQKTFKQFSAYDPVAGTSAKFSMANAGCEANFVCKLPTAFPFGIEVIQVDGGSEFVAEFEMACKAITEPSFVLPPQRPHFNGTVERAQGSWRYEFRACHDLPHRLDRLQPTRPCLRSPLQQLPTPWGGASDPRTVCQPLEPGRARRATASQMCSSRTDHTLRLLDVPYSIM